MRRSLVLSTLVILSGLVGCRAQEDRKNLQNSVTRLEQRLANMDDYLKSLQAGQQKQKEEQSRAQASRDEELHRLQKLLAEHERMAKEHKDKAERQRAEFERAVAQQKEAMAAEMARVKDQLNAERQQMRAHVAEEQKRVEAHALQAKAAEKDTAARMRAEMEKANANVRQNAEKARADMEKASQVAAQRMENALNDAHRQRDEARQLAERARHEAEQMKKQLGDSKAASKDHGNDRAALLEGLSNERREISKLRAQVMDDLKAAKSRGEQGDELEKLRAENARLKDRISRFEAEHARLKAAAAADAEKKKMPPMLAAPVAARRVAAMTSDLLLPPVAPAHSAPATPAPTPAHGHAPGTIIINNEDGEVHIHIHGGSPHVVTNSNKPSVSSATPSAAKKPMILSLDDVKVVGAEPKVRARALPPAVVEVETARKVPKAKAKKDDDDDGDDENDKPRAKNVKVMFAPLKASDKAPATVEGFDVFGAPPKKKTESKPVKPPARTEEKPKERRINDEDAPPIDSLIQVLLSAF